MAFATTQSPNQTNEVDPRPGVWIGHIGPHPVTDLDAAVDFFEQLGTRTVAVMGHMAILELRGGTHLIVQKVASITPGSRATFDLMVDDLRATHRELVDRGLAVSAIEDTGGIHSSFVVTDPSGTGIIVNSTHAMGPV